MPKPIARTGDEILCAARDVADFDHIIQALEQLHLPGRLLGRGVDEAVIERLAGRWVIEAGVVDFNGIMDRFRMVIGYGGLGLASQALAAGLPQLILATDTEKLLNGHAIEQIGIGRVLRARATDRETIIRAAAQLYVDPRIRDRALEVARQHEAILTVDPIDIITAKVMSLS